MQAGQLAVLGPHTKMGMTKIWGRSGEKPQASTSSVLLEASAQSATAQGCTEGTTQSQQPWEYPFY